MGLPSIISCSIANITYCYKASEINIAARTFLTLFGSTSFQCLFGSYMCIRLRCAGNRDFEPSVKTTFKTPIPVSAAQFADRCVPLLIQKVSNHLYLRSISHSTYWILNDRHTLINVPTVPSRIHSSRTRSDPFGTPHESFTSERMDPFEQNSYKAMYD